MRGTSRTSERSFPQIPVTIPAQEASLEGDLTIPAGARGLILFAHGSGSSHLSPRNRHVARQFQKTGMATLLFDLLTPDEENVDLLTGELRFNIAFLSRRLLAATDWVERQEQTRRLNLGYFGASTGAAAALVAAAERQHEIRAVVSRGGRPDLAGESLAGVRAPTLLIVGGDDTEVIAMNEDAARQLTVTHKLEIVPGATHLFEEPGKLDEVALLATAWFSTYLDLR
jgi:dienelactone hydrolase